LTVKISNKHDQQIISNNDIPIQARGPYHFLFEIHGEEDLFQHNRFQYYNEDEVNIFLDSIKSYFFKPSPGFLSKCF